MRDRAFFRLTKPVPSNAEGTEAGDIGCIVDGAPDVHRDRQAENKPLEARSSFQTEPNSSRGNSSLVHEFVLAVTSPVKIDAVGPQDILQLADFQLAGQTPFLCRHRRRKSRRVTCRDAVAHALSR